MVSRGSGLFWSVWPVGGLGFQIGSAFAEDSKKRGIDWTVRMFSIDLTIR